MHRNEYTNAYVPRIGVYDIFTPKGIREFN